MGKSLVGKIIYFWIFIIGGLFVFRFVAGISLQNTRLVIILLIVLTVIYWGLAFLRAMRGKDDSGDR